MKDFRRSDTLKVHYKTHLKPRKGDYGDVPPPYTTIQVPVEQMQYQEQPQVLEVLENVEFMSADQIDLPSYEMHLQDISYAIQETQPQQLIQSNVSFAFWTADTYNELGGSGITTTNTTTATQL